MLRICADRKVLRLACNNLGGGGRRHICGVSQYCGWYFYSRAYLLFELASIAFE